MKVIVIEELEKELNWKERIILKIFKKYSYKIYIIAQKKIFNNMLTE